MLLQERLEISYAKWLLPRHLVDLLCPLKVYLLQPLSFSETSPKKILLCQSKVASSWMIFRIGSLLFHWRLDNYPTTTRRICSDYSSHKVVNAEISQPSQTSWDDSRY